ncbi:Scr1 family TA system antitoxin-like transcriptional regulator [Streptomyces sp. NPDC048550]|uniref:Scr1 family TA system antitoxin-like transcriptional regulator n=1 Tax=Streptomyces sp. NPDC048550 TaxID=3155739 RepID=UPI00341BF774
MSLLWSSYGPRTRGPPVIRISPRLSSVLSAVPESPLHATFASGPGIMQDQLRKLLDVSELPNTKVRIVPLTAHPTYGSNSSMTILTFNHPWAPVASIDNPMGGNHTEDPEQAQILEAEFDHIASAALPVDKPRDLLIEYMERLHK